MNDYNDNLEYSQYDRVSIGQCDLEIYYCKGERCLNMKYSV